MDAGQPATAPVIEGPATANELVSAPHDFTHVRDCGHPTVCRRGGRIRNFECAGRAGRLPVLAIPGARQPDVSREDSAASPPQQRLPRMAAASNAAASRRIQPPPPAAASTAATALCCPGAAAATSVTATSHECHRRQRRHGHCRRQGGERGAPYVCMRCVSGGCRFLYRKRRYFE